MRDKALKFLTITSIIGISIGVVGFPIIIFVEPLGEVYMTIYKIAMTSLTIALGCIFTALIIIIKE